MLCGTYDPHFDQFLDWALDYIVIPVKYDDYCCDFWAILKK